MLQAWSERTIISYARGPTTGMDGRGHSLGPANGIHEWDSPADPGVRIADVNGDGLPDILQGWTDSAENSHYDAWLNTGHGWTRRYRMESANDIRGRRYQEIPARTEMAG